MQTVKITLLSSLLSQTLSQTKYYRYAVNPPDNDVQDFIDRQLAADYCNFAHGGLATILSITDNHDARTICDHADGCWIGVKGYNCNADTGCANYEWDDGSALTDYGFSAGGAEGNGWIQNVYVHVDGPWKDFNGVDEPESCVYIIPGDVDPGDGNDIKNMKWNLANCDDGVTTRGTLCNIETPAVEVFFYSMQDDTGVNDWERSHPSALYQRPLVTNKERCKYANDPTDPTEVPQDPLFGGEASIILQGCWAITNPGNDDIVHLAHFESLVGYEDCVLQFNIDPWASDSVAVDEEACQVSYTIDSGVNWTPLAKYDDLVEETIFLPLPVFANGQIKFGFRFTLDPTVTGITDKDAVECYFNNVHLWCDTV